MPGKLSHNRWIIGLHAADLRRGHEARLLRPQRPAGGHVDVRRERCAVERREGLVARQEEDVVRLRDHSSVRQRLADAEHRPPHDRPRDRQLLGLLFPNRDDVLRIGQQAAEGPQSAW